MKLMITSGTIHNQVCITGRESMTIMRTIENNLCHQHMCQVSSQYHHLHNHRLYSSTDSIQLLSCYMVWTIILWFASWQLVTGHHNMQVTKIIVSCEISYVLNILMIRKKLKCKKKYPSASMHGMVKLLKVGRYQAQFSGMKTIKISAAHSNIHHFLSLEIFNNCNNNHVTWHQPVSLQTLEITSRLISSINCN